MIDEDRQDLAAEYVLDALDAAAARAFEAELASDPELRGYTDELRETTASLAQAVPQHLPPPELRERVLSSIRGEATPAVPSPGTKKPVQTGGAGLLPWALAAGFAITTGALWFERDQLRVDSTSARAEARGLRAKETTAKESAVAFKKEIETLRNKATELRARDEAAKERLATLTKDLETLRLQNTDLQNRDALSKVRIATLTGQVASLAKATAVIVWDPTTQRGVIRLANLPKLEAGKDYQLWVIDPKYPQPVDGGVIPMQQDGSTQISFKADQPIEKADKFAISIEPAGGVPKATGPIILLGN